MRNQNQMQIQFNKGLLEEICEMSNLDKAFKLVKKNKGVPGIDGITIKDFETNLFEELTQLRKEILNWKYRPTPVNGLLRR